MTGVIWSIKRREYLICSFSSSPYKTTVRGESSPLGHGVPSHQVTTWILTTVGQLDGLSYHFMQWKVNSYDEIDKKLEILSKSNKHLKITKGWKTAKLATEKEVSNFISSAGARNKLEVEDGVSLPDYWDEDGGGRLNNFDGSSDISNNADVLAPTPRLS